ncbi:MAG: acyl--CoA ligase [Gammaproteobacteria bacterium]|nr:acyl--CoA ligase [Gammaproteobacteria bacterium]
MATAEQSPEALALLGRGGPFEIIEAEIRGVRLPVFRNAPVHLRELYQSALEYADETFYVYEGERFSFANAWREAELVASALQALGVAAGDRVGISMRNYPEWLWSFMGITSVGAVAVAMNAWWSGDEMIYGIDDSGLNTLFVDRERLEHLAPYLDEKDLDVIAVRTEHTSGHGVRSWDDFIAGASGVAPPAPDIQPDDNAMILYTSGSTSHPKGVLSSHRAIIHSLLGWEAAAALARANSGRPPRPRDMQPSMILTVPLFHVTGLNGQLLPSFRNGRKVVGMYKWEAEKALAIIEREKVTHFSGVPTMAYELVNSPNYHQYDLSSLRSIGGGGAAMTRKHSQRIDERSNNQVRASAAYGMTETNGLAASNAGANLRGRPNSCGKALPPLVEIRITDPDGNELPRASTGEIWIRGPMNFSGYWNRAEDSAETLVDGWVRTGDLGHMDDEDFVFITDREKDMIIRGGENIGCQEVEAAIYDHPAVAECAVFGVPDERLGETVAAVIMVKGGELLTAGDIQSHVGEHLARFKVPQHVWTRKEQLPRTASGKIYKRGLREESIAWLQEAS